MAKYLVISVFSVIYGGFFRCSEGGWQMVGIIQNLESEAAGGYVELIFNKNDESEDVDVENDVDEIIFAMGNLIKLFSEGEIEKLDEDSFKVKLPGSDTIGLKNSKISFDIAFVINGEAYPVAKGVIYWYESRAIAYFHKQQEE